MVMSSEGIPVASIRRSRRASSPPRKKYIFEIEPENRFELDPEFLADYEGRQPAWGYGDLSYVTYKRTYARAVAGEGRTEEFWETARRVIEGMFSILQQRARTANCPWDEDEAQEKAQEAYRRMWAFKWLPPGRGLFFMGTEALSIKGGAALNNCFGPETEIITAEGVKTIGSLVGTTQTLLTKNGKWVEAPINSFGKQRLWRLTLTRQGIDKVIYTTEDHRWFAEDRRKQYREQGHAEFKTSELRPEIHRLQYVFGQGIKGIDYSPFGVAHGFAFGDGVTVPGNRNSNRVPLIGDKDAALRPYFNLCPTHARADGMEFSAIPNYFKQCPSIKETKAYLLGWLMGYFAADGTVTANGVARIASVNKENIAFVRDVCTVLGVGTYSIREETRTSNLTERPHTMYTLGFMRSTLTEEFFLIPAHRENFLENGGDDVETRHWTVKNIEATDRFEEVFCATVPDTHSFVLEGNILTGNCGFVSTRNIHKNFSQPFCDLADNSMLGVGMGFDLRGAGAACIVEPEVSDETFVVEDSREGWIEAIRVVLEAFAGNGQLPRGFDVSGVRAEGTPLATFGGTASGPAPLVELLDDLKALLSSRPGPIAGTTIVAIMNMIGRCVVAGNVRRSSEIALGSPDDADFIALKDPSESIRLSNEMSAIEQQNDQWVDLDQTARGWKDLQRSMSPLSKEFAQLQDAIDEIRAEQKKVLQSDLRWHSLKARQDALPLFRYLWASNNSALCTLGKTDYSKLARQTVANGEPGYGWLEVIRRHGRLADLPNDSDKDVMGFNPCQPASALVLTKEGIRTFDDIDVGSVIWSGKQWTKVVNKVATGVKPVYRYVTTAGSFVGTEDHRVVCRGEKIPVGEVDVIDISVGPSPEVLPLNPQDVLDGLMLGDGMYHAASDRNLLNQGAKDDSWDQSEVGPLLGHKADWGKGPGIYVRYAETTLCEPLPKTYERRVPEKFLHGNTVAVRGLLRGLYSANGSVVRTRVTLKAASLDVVRGVQALLSSIGIASYYTTNPAHDVEFENGLFTCRESYDLNIGAREHRRLFRDLVGFLQPYKAEALDAICDTPINKYANGRSKTSFDVVEVEPLGEQAVFDITVDAEEHTYWTNGLLVSNCGEQQLHDMELCCLVETFPTRHDSLDDYLTTLKYAYLYAKVVSLVPTHNPRTNAVMTANRRIGTSMAGIFEMYSRLGMRECVRWWDTGYRYLRDLDREYSRWLGVNKSIRITSVKPGGTIPLLVGVEGGMKLPIARHYIRTIRVAENSPLVGDLRRAGYRIEKDRTTPRTMVAYFPCEAPEGVRTAGEVSLWEQAAIFTALQRWWSDNMVSATLTFQPREAPEVENVLRAHEGQWKCVSFLPLSNHGFLQAPYIPCTEEEHAAMRASLKPLSVTEGDTHEVAAEDKYCQGGFCEAPVRTA